MKEEDMRDKLLSIAAFAVLLGFLAVLVYEVPRFDLAGVVIFTLVLAGYDFYRSARERR
jgi:hypothetical protein